MSLQQEVFVIKDVVAGVSHHLFEAINVNVAIRMFKGFLQNSNEANTVSPTDLQLWRVARFDRASLEFSDSSPTLIVAGDSLLAEGGSKQGGVD